MGFFKELDVERLQIETSKEEAERAALQYLQPVLSPEFAIPAEADSLLDFVKAYKLQKMKSRYHAPALTRAN